MHKIKFVRLARTELQKGKTLHEIFMRNINHDMPLLFFITSKRYLILSRRGVMEMEGRGSVGVGEGIWSPQAEKTSSMTIV